MGPYRQKINVGALSDRRKSRPTPKPWVVRWSVDAVPKAASFPSKATAELFRSGLITAVHAGERFDERTGLPVLWAPKQSYTVLEWTREWLAGEWDDLELRTRSSLVEAPAFFVIACRPGEAPVLNEEGHTVMRRYLRDSLRLKSKAPAEEPMLEKVIAKWSLPLSALDPDLLHKVDQQLSTRLDGTPRGNSGKKYKKVARQCVRAALARRIITADPFPPTPPGCKTRKKNRLTEATVPKEVPTLAEIEPVLAALVSHQPSSRDYAVMSGVAFYAGLRPSEVDDLMVKDLSLPLSGFGKIEVERANVRVEEPGKPKNGKRSVPIPPVLVEILRGHLTRHGLTDGFLFRTSEGKRLTNSNWNRNLKNGCRIAGVEPMTPYTLRAANATMLASSGAPDAEIAARLGHSVEMLHRHYLLRPRGGQEEANEMILAYLDKAS